MRWSCATCGSEHDELPFDWAFEAPTFWDGPHGPNDLLGSDLCVWTDADGRECYFVRGLVELPVVDADNVFNYGVWSSLSQESFERVAEDAADLDVPGYFGWLSNEIPEFAGSLGLPLDVWTRGAELRPTFVLHDGAHPLVAAQRGGVTRDWVARVAEAHLHA